MIGEFAYLPIHEEMERLDAEEAELERLMNGEFADEEEDDWDFERDRNAVKVEFIHGEVDDIIKLQGPTLEILLKVANDMQMNGMLLTDKKIEFTKYEP